MKGSMKLCKHPDTYPGDELYCIHLKFIEMTERETLMAIDMINNKVYLAVYAVALTPKVNP